ncbi:MAG: hydantoinase B/oxoprolinase family protein, partial [Pseudomonadota bacterium]
EQAGPVLILRKELRPDSGGAGRQRGGLGQFMSVSVAEGHEFDFSAMFDRVDHPAEGRAGGGDGAPTFIHQDDGTAMRGKGRQFVPPGRTVVMGFPGGAGYGEARERDEQAVRRDLALGYISAEAAERDYGLIRAAQDEVAAQVAAGEEF